MTNHRNDYFNYMTVYVAEDRLDYTNIFCRFTDCVHLHNQ